MSIVNPKFSRSNVLAQHQSTARRRHREEARVLVGRLELERDFYVGGSITHLLETLY